MEPHADGRADAFGPLMVGEGTLRSDSGQDRISGPLEDEEKALALILIDMTVCRLHGVPEQTSVVCESP